jgi:hypothetical protein
MIEASFGMLGNLAGNRVSINYFMRYMMIERKIGMLETPLVTGFLFFISKRCMTMRGLLICWYQNFIFPCNETVILVKINIPIKKSFKPL